MRAIIAPDALQRMHTDSGRFEAGLDGPAFLDVLSKVADRQLLGDRDRALVGSFLADHHTEKRCLARPVGTDQSDFFAGIQLKRSIHEEQPLATLLIDV
jgi:hypothetical protein